MEIIDMELNDDENNKKEQFDNLKSLIVDGDTPSSSSDESLIDETKDNKISPFFNDDKKNNKTPGKKKIRDVMKLVINKLTLLSELTEL